MPQAVVTAVPATISRNDYTGTVGFRFRAAVDFTVGHIGRVVSVAFAQSHTVSLWSDAGTLLGSTSVSSASATQHGYAFGPVTPVSLTSGTYYRIASTEFNGGDTWANALAVPHTSEIDTIMPVYASGDAFPAIQIPQHSGKGYVWPNLYIADAVTPDAQRRRSQQQIIKGAF